MSINKKLKLGIVGHGFVGKATDFGFNNEVEKLIIDPLYSNSVENLKDFNPEIVFICVPTPMSDDGSQNYTIVENVVKDLVKYCPNSIKVIKSTLLPGILNDLSSIDSKLIYNPEFLREKHANYDFINSKMIILGGDKNSASVVSKAYLSHSKCVTKNHVFTDLLSASLIKYSINTFLASKVIFFNELFAIYEKLGVNDSWESIIDIISMDERIGNSHMDVPGHDGKKGFGGACFPKDTVAFIKYANDENTKLSTLETVVRTNNKIRSSYKDLDSRESEQNISYDDKI